MAIKIKNDKIDIGTIATVSEFHTNTVEYTRSPDRKHRKLLKRSYETAKVCLKGEYKRQNLSEEEYNTLLTDLKDEYENIMTEQHPSQEKKTENGDK